MSRILAGLFPVLLLVPIALGAQAPLQPEPIVEWVATEPEFELGAVPAKDAHEHLETMLQPPTQTVVATFIGSGIGLGLGAAAGLVIGRAIDDPRDRGGMVPIPSLPIVLLTPAGAAVGSWAGARIGNRGRGNPFRTATGSMLGIAAGVGVGVGAGLLTGSGYVGLALGLPVAIYLPARAELRTTPAQ